MAGLRGMEAQAWDGRAQAVWDAIMAANQAMLEFLQREAGYSRAGYHAKNSGRFADAHEWVIASFRQHTEPTRQQALAADTELRRRHPGIELPALHLIEEPAAEAGELAGVQPQNGVSGAGEVRGEPARAEETRLDLSAALEAARRAQAILAERQRQANQ